MNSVIINILRFLLLLFVQVFLLKNIVFYGLNTPYLYILFILLLPFQTPKFILFTSAFLLGLTIDLFNDTLGLHAAASTVLAFVRIMFISITVSKENIETEPEPSMGVMGFRWFFFYSLILTLIHHFVLLNLEVFRISEIPFTLGRVVLSSIFTLLLMFVTEIVFFKKKKQRK